VRDWIVGKLAIFGGLVLVFVSGFLLGTVRERGAWEDATAKAQAALKASNHVIDSLYHERAKVDTLYRVDTVKVDVTKVRYVVLRDSLLKTLQDSLKGSHSLEPRQVLLVIGAADRALDACHAALHDCDKLRVVNDSLVSALRSRPTVVATDTVTTTKRAWWRDRVVIYGGHALFSPDWQLGAGIAFFRWP
jgi:hypothetical protein